MVREIGKIKKILLTGAVVFLLLLVGTILFQAYSLKDYRTQNNFLLDQLDQCHQNYNKNITEKDNGISQNKNSEEYKILYDKICQKLFNDENDAARNVDCQEFANNESREDENGIYEFGINAIKIVSNYAADFPKEVNYNCWRKIKSSFNWQTYQYPKSRVQIITDKNLFWSDSLPDITVIKNCAKPDFNKSCCKELEKVGYSDYCVGDISNNQMCNEGKASIGGEAACECLSGEGAAGASFTTHNYLAFDNGNCYIFKLTTAVSSDRSDCDANDYDQREKLYEQDIETNKKLLEKSLSSIKFIHPNIDEK